MLQKCLTTTDDRAKRLLAQKSILAHILVKTVDEFKGMNWKDVVSYIESEPYISIVPIEPGLTNIENIDSKGQKIIGLNTENSEINEGLVRFDIIFYVRMRDGLSQIIINIEAQKDNPSAYHVLNRAIFYVCRLVSSQKERDFVNTNYDDIKRVVSIWICMNMKENTLNCFKLEDQALLGNYKWEGKLDMLNIVLIGLSKELPEYDEQSELHRLLCVLLSNKITPNDKMDIIEKEYNIPIRVGVNSGSLEKHILAKYGRPTPQALCDSALYHASLLEKFDFGDIVLSMKSSNVEFMTQAYELAARQCDYPLHLGVTEAGTERMGIIKSSVGIGSLLLRGIGDTIRVSLTDDPVKEVIFAKRILETVGMREKAIEVVSCPTCGRTKIDLISLANEVQERLRGCEKNIKVAVMGCVVNGPGEAREADYGIAGGNGMGLVFKKGEILYKVSEDKLVDALIDEINKD